MGSLGNNSNQSWLTDNKDYHNLTTQEHLQQVLTWLGCTNCANTMDMRQKKRHCHCINCLSEEWAVKGIIHITPRCRM